MSSACTTHGQRVTGRVHGGVALQNGTIQVLFPTLVHPLVLSGWFVSVLGMHNALADGQQYRSIDIGLIMYLTI